EYYISIDTSQSYITYMIININTPSFPGKRLMILRRASQGCEDTLLGCSSHLFHDAAHNAFMTLPVHTSRKTGIVGRKSRERLKHVTKQFPVPLPIHHLAYTALSGRMAGRTDR